MATIQLTRKQIPNNQPPVKNRPVYGTLTLPFGNKPQSYDTLENADFLIPAGTYPLQMTWSPKFKKFMPEICNVPDREGIRIHMGTRPEHSTGCVLVSQLALENTKSFIYLIKKYYEDEEVFISITDP